MSYYFPRDTQLGYLERFMQMPPDYRFRGSGMAAFHYSASQCDCRSCLYSRGRKHRCCPCVCLEERMEAGCVTYAELLLHIIAEINYVNFTKRARDMLKREVKELFFNGKQHKNRWHGCLMTGLIPASAEPDFAAVMFLLTSDDEVWALAKRYISLGTVRFGDIPIRGISVKGYTILKAAKELGGTTRQFYITELADAEIVDDKLFRLIVNVFVIHGLRAAKS